MDGGTGVEALTLAKIIALLAYVNQYNALQHVAGENYHCEQSRKW
jgi:hypothetical protein